MLVVQAQMRDHAAFHELVRRYERRVLYYIRRMVGDGEESLDVAQEVWLLVFRRLASLDAPEAFRVWLYKIAHDVTVTHLRRRKRPAALPLEEITTTDQADDWNELEALEQADLVHRTLEQLSPPHREALTLRFLEGLEVAEIAEVVGCSPGTVKSRLHYAKHALREQLQGLRHV